MFERIVVAVDGSEHSHKAAETASAIARWMSSDLWIVTVYDPLPSYLGDPNLQEAIDKRLEQAEVIVEDAKQIIGSLPCNVHVEILEGPVAEAILSVVEARSIDLVVMGTRGLGRLTGLLLGSQSQKVVSHASCPVLLVR